MTEQAPIAARSAVANLPAAFDSSSNLWHYLMQLPHAAGTQVFIALFMSGVVGMISHYIMKWAQTSGGDGFIDYVQLQGWKRAVIAFATLVGLILSTLGSGIFTTDLGEFVGWTNVLWIGLTTGFSIESATHGNRRMEWSDDTRTAKAVEVTHVRVEPIVVKPLTGEPVEVKSADVQPPKETP